jgi:hypothetical protein
MKIEFDQIYLNFENIDGDDERLNRISSLIWKLLDEKFQRDINVGGDDRGGGSSFSSRTNRRFSAHKLKSNSLTLDRIEVPPIRIGSDTSDYDIASHCASAIYQAVIMKLR